MPLILMVLHALDVHNTRYIILHPIYVKYAPMALSIMQLLRHAQYAHRMRLFLVGIDV